VWRFSSDPSLLRVSVARFITSGIVSSVSFWWSEMNWLKVFVLSSVFSVLVVSREYLIFSSASILMRMKFGFCCRYLMSSSLRIPSMTIMFSCECLTSSAMVRAIMSLPNVSRIIFEHFGMVSLFCGRYNLSRMSRSIFEY